MAKKSAVLALVLLLLVVAACSDSDHHKNVCPIDGQPPEWSSPGNGNSCEYFHFSVVEKKTHSWLADCKSR